MACPLRCSAFKSQILGGHSATDAAGATLWQETYTPFGEGLQLQSANQQPLGFQGKPQDKETGLSYFGARYYDAAVGRFLANDPVGFGDDNAFSFNRYAYGNNNPYKYTDPDGRDPENHNPPWTASAPGGGNFAGTKGTFPGGRAAWRAYLNEEESIQNNKSNSIGLAGDDGVNSSGGAAGALQIADSKLNAITKTILSLKPRVTQNFTRLGGKPGEPAITVTFTDGTTFNMTLTRVKQTELNPKSPTGISPVKFDKSIALDSSRTKRAPTREELAWFKTYFNLK